jgi:hypothetical protein
MSGEVQVRIRHAEEARAVPLTIWPVTGLEGLVRHLKSWGVYDETEDDAELVGQFVIDGGEAYFEIIVGG